MAGRQRPVVPADLQAAFRAVTPGAREGMGRGWMEATTVDVAQLVESRVVIPVVVGSSPIVHPTQ